MAIRTVWRFWYFFSQLDSETREMTLMQYSLPCVLTIYFCEQYHKIMSGNNIIFSIFWWRSGIWVHLGWVPLRTLMVCHLSCRPDQWRGGEGDGGRMQEHKYT